jgi:hypothetical protein
MLLWYKIKKQIIDSLFLKDRLVVAILGGVLATFCGMWYSIATIFRDATLQNGPDLVPLHYNIYFGADYYGPFYYISGFLAVSEATFFVHTYLAYYFYNRFRLLSHVLMVTLATIHVMLAGALSLIIIFNL